MRGGLQHLTPTDGDEDQQHRGRVDRGHDDERGADTGELVQQTAVRGAEPLDDDAPGRRRTAPLRHVEDQLAQAQPLHRQDQALREGHDQQQVPPRQGHDRRCQSRVEQVQPVALAVRAELHAQEAGQHEQQEQDQEVRRPGAWPCGKRLPPPGQHSGSREEPGHQHREPQPVPRAPLPTAPTPQREHPRRQSHAPYDAEPFPGRPYEELLSCSP